MPTFPAAAVVAKGRAEDRAMARLEASPPKPRYIPSPEQLAAQKARREAQQRAAAEAKAKAQGTVIENTRRTVPWREHVNPRQVGNAAASLAVLGGTAALVHRRRSQQRSRLAVAKRDSGNAALGAVGGAAGVDAAYVVGGQAAKARIKIVRNRRGLTPAEEKVWAEHKAAAGLKPGEQVRGSTPAKVKHRLFAHYPKELPGWRAQRALGWKNHNGVYAGALAAGALAGGALASRKVDKRVTGGPAFALVGALSGGTGLGTAAALHRERHPDAAREAALGTAGGWAGQGVYQGLGYGAKWRAQVKDEPKASRGKRDKALKPVKREHGAYTPAMERHYPRSLPEWKTHRVLGWTHRGRTGTALGAAFTAGGAATAMRAGQSKRAVAKADRVYGFEERKRSLPRTAELAAGLGLAAWGASRLDVAPLASLGVNLARAKGYGPQAAATARAVVRASAAIRRATGYGAAMVGDRVPGIGTSLELIPPKMRPRLAAAVGTTLAYRATPTTDERFVPYGGR